jgi:L-lactate dehydrogenase (cytochrome)
MKGKQFQRIKGLPDLSKMINLIDFEIIAQKFMNPSGWSYYSSAADDEVSFRENQLAFQRIWLKPRVLVDVSSIDISCKIFSYPSSFPVYISATALGKLGHPEGEVVLTRAAGNQNIIQMIPTLASCSLHEMTSAAKKGQTQFFQLYVNKDRDITKALVQKAEESGCKALFITVDAPVLAKREKDIKYKFSGDGPHVQKGSNLDGSQGVARSISSFIDPSLCWSDLKWFKTITKIPIVLKGIQCSEDAVLALIHGVDGIVISNHGGRQLDFSRSSIEILPDVIESISCFPQYQQGKFQIFIDGGIRRGTDIFKALALGATAVGIGRPFLCIYNIY